VGAELLALQFLQRVKDIEAKCQGWGTQSFTSCGSAKSVVHYEETGFQLDWNLAAHVWGKSWIFK